MVMVNVAGNEYSMDEGLRNKWDSLKDGKLADFDEDRFYIVDGSEGCLSKDTLIKTSSGDLTIEELNNGKSFEVESLNISTKKNEKGKAICLKSGIKEVYEIETTDGRKIKATHNHTFFVLRDGEVIELMLSQLKEGDNLICQ